MSAPILEIITIGREILDGRVIDTNSVWLAEMLGERGVIPRYAQKVDDEKSRVVEAFRIAQKRSQFVLVTGGLGPTSDDLTAEAFARFAKKTLVFNEEGFAQVEGAFRRMNRPLAATLETQRKQAMLPTGCRILGNSEGTAPGFSFLLEGVSWFFMPGVPKEMKVMFTGEVLPNIPVVEGYRSFNWVTQFTSEGELQQRLLKITGALDSDFEISYRTRFPENHIGLHGVCDNAALSGRFDATVANISGLLGPDVFCAGRIQSLEQVVVDLLRAKSAVLGTVESCTGGLVANRITDVAGSSDVFWSAWVTYDNRAKVELGVPPHLIETHGAVSAEVAMALASAGLKKLKTLGAPHPICVATTGIAGPTGGSAEKPVGLCFVAIARDGHAPEWHETRSRLGLRRTENKLFFSQKALELVRRSLL